MIAAWERAVGVFLPTRCTITFFGGRLGPPLPRLQLRGEEARGRVAADAEGAGRSSAQTKPSAPPACGRRWGGGKRARSNFS